MAPNENLEQLAEMQMLLVRLQELSDGLGDRPQVVEITNTVARLRAQLDALSHGTSAQTSAHQHFDHVKSIDHVFQSLARRWDEFKTDAGKAVAHEVIIGADLYRGWSRRWTQLTEYAWLKRGQMEDEDDLPLMVLDLRYGAGLPFSSIAELLNLSPASIQIRVSSFEASVAEAFAIERLKPQVPDGWELQTDGRPRIPGRSDLLLRRLVPMRPRFITLQVLPVWEERDSGAGRPRSNPRLERGAASTPRIWVVVFTDEARVLFVPEAVVTSQTESTAIPANVLAVQIARDAGYEILSDAVDTALSMTSTGEG